MAKISERPYEQRRFVIVTSDIRKESRSTSGADTGSLVGGVAGAVIGGVLLGPSVLLVAPIAWAASKAGKAVGWTAGAVADANAGNIPPLKDVPPGMLLATPADAKEDLRFPPGHPIERGVYAAHPLVADRYLPVETFHQHLFQEKADELLLLLASLGATRVRIHAKRGYRSSNSASAGWSEGKNRAGGSVGFSSRVEHESQWEEQFRGATPPATPPNAIWLPHEPSWSELARRRLDFGTTKARTSLLYENAYSVDAKLKATLEGVGLSIGGSFKEFESTEWEVESDFAT